MEKTSDKIIAYIKQSGRASGKELSDFLGITDRSVRKQLRGLFNAGRLSKVGNPPRVFYIIPEKKDREGAVFSWSEIDSEKQNCIEENFLHVTSRGERFGGKAGFVKWCEDRNMSIEKKVEEYWGLFKKYDALKKEGVISGKKKMQDTFGENLFADDIFYADFYAWEIFGKTKLGQLLLYGKQSQDKKIMTEVIRKIRTPVKNLLRRKNIDAVGFVPPTVKREVQFMTVLQKGLNLPLPVVELVKAKTEIITPQKTLSKLSQRIENAEHAMFVTDGRKFSNVLLIDDAVGSGATINQVAGKIKRAGIAKKVYGFSITGSAKGFDVISEV